MLKFEVGIKGTFVANEIYLEHTGRARVLDQVFDKQQLSIELKKRHRRLTAILRRMKQRRTLKQKMRGLVQRHKELSKEHETRRKEAQKPLTYCQPCYSRIEHALSRSCRDLPVKAEVVGRQLRQQMRVRKSLKHKIRVLSRRIARYGG